MRISAGVSKCGPWKPRYTPSGRSGSTVRASGPQPGAVEVGEVDEAGAERRRRVGTGQRRPAGQVDVVADQHRLADRPVRVQRAGAVGQHDRVAAAGGGDAHAVGDDGGVVTLVEVDPAEEDEHPRPATSIERTRRRGRPPTAREPGQVGDGDRRPGRRARRRSGPIPSRARRPRRGADAGAVGEHVGRPGSEARTGRGEAFTALDPTIRGDAHHRVAWRPRRAGRPDPAAPRVTWLEVARRRHDDRRHPAAGRAGRAGDRRGGWVRRRPGRAAGRAGRAGREFVRGEAERIAAARPTAVNLAWAVAACVAHGRRRDGRPSSPRPSSWPRRTCGPTGRSPSGGRPAGGLWVRRCACTPTATPAAWPASSGGPRWASCGRCTSGGSLASVTAGETRPLLQGARLTAFELVAAGHRAPDRRRRRRAVGDRQGSGRRRHRGRRPHRRQRRRRQQDRHLPAGARRGPRRHPVRRGRSGVDARPGDADRRGHRDRGARPRTRCSGRRAAGGPGGLAGDEPGVRRDAGRSGDGDRHRAAGDPPAGERGERRPRSDVRPPLAESIPSRPAPRRRVSRQRYIVRRVGVSASPRCSWSASAGAGRRWLGGEAASRRRRRRVQHRPPPPLGVARPAGETAAAAPTVGDVRRHDHRRPSADTSPPSRRPGRVHVVGDSDAGTFAPYLKSCSTTRDRRRRPSTTRCRRPGPPRLLRLAGARASAAAGGRPGHRRRHVRRQRCPGSGRTRRVVPQRRPGRGQR